MTQYIAPRRDAEFVLYEFLEIERELTGIPAYTEMNRDLFDQVLKQASKFAEDVLFPLNAVGDKHGCRFEDGSVTTPPGFRAAYRQYVEAGWPSLVSDPAYGGQGIPHAVGVLVQEMVNSANQAWSMYGSLTHGASAALRMNGTDEQKSLYLPKLVAGTWTGTMCLTEPQCGTDLGLVRTKATPASDGTYNISGTKIFVSSGEHDLCENIVHLVLARLPDGPPNTKGLSLFLVPKFILDVDGKPARRNHVVCESIEHKMGIHGNSTCVMSFEEATGWLVGAPHRGLPAMFVMMNGARLGVALQGLGLTEVAYQNALAYAKERLQSRSLSGPKAPSKPADPIISHPDVRRMLLTQKAYAEGGRALIAWIAFMVDKHECHSDAEVKRECDELVALLTPVAKAFLTDNAFHCTNLALQVFGGHGYIREAGVEQYVRDARIGTIYEGTNAVQSLDLLGRKVLMDQGQKLRRLGAVLQRFGEECREPAMAEFVDPVQTLYEKLERLTFEIGLRAKDSPDEVGAAAADYLRIVGHLVFAYVWARMAKVALDRRSSRDPIYESKLATARFYFARLLPETESLFETARSGARNLLELDAALF